MATVNTLPILSITRKGKIIVFDNGVPISRFAGIAYDVVVQSFVLIDLITGWIEYLVSETLDNAQHEIEYLRAKFA